ncbi:hypothetical protein LTS17_002027 [Exophiala oligosperma]
MPTQVSSTPPAVAETSSSLRHTNAQSPSLSLEVATPIEHVRTAHLNAEEWRGCLTAEQYCAREAVLHNTDLTREGGITCWILTTTLEENLPKEGDADGPSSRPIFASCESILFHAYVAQEGRLKQVRAHGIGTVYTPAEHRGKGYAGRMMADLGPRLEIWQQQQQQQIPRGALKKNAASLLFSDIGPSYYARFGWEAHPSNHVHLSSLKDRDSYYRESAKLDLPSVHDLTAVDLPGIPAVSHLRHELLSKSAADPETTYFAVLPSVEHFRWHHAREEFVCRSLGKQIPVVKGAIHEATGLALIWSRVFAKDQDDWQLHVLHTVIPPAAAQEDDLGGGGEKKEEAERAMSALLLRAQFESYSWGMLGGVEIWDPPSLVVRAATRLGQGHCDLVERHRESICSLRWAGKHQEDQPVWISKQKYAWC